LPRTTPQPVAKQLKPESDTQTNNSFAPTAKPATQSATSRTEQKIKPVSFEKTTWTVNKNDSFWSIAQSNYGDGRFFRALYEANRRIVPGFENLTEGVELNLPTADELCERYPDLCPSDAVRKNDPWRTTPDKLMEDLTEACECDLDQRLYETRQGDTLFGIARRQLGQASRYVELIELNQFRIDDNVTHETELPLGIQLLLPEN
jgi:nucleoid-associated protein YgaU